jgi:cation:H+ antiporter
MILEGRELAVFVVSLVVMSLASVRLATVLERIASRLRFSDGLLGIVTALGADAPEICSAFAALLSDHHEVGLGVVIGSNIFNLAGLLGLSALVAGRVTIGRQGLWFNGGTSLVVSVVVVALLLQWISVWFSLLLLALVLVPYVALTAMHPPQIVKLRLPPAIKSFFSTAVGHSHNDARKRLNIPHASWKDGLWAIVSLLLIVLSSFSAVDTAVSLGSSWGISEAVLGMLILAALTSVPNVIAAIYLARDGRGAAVVSESLNSNTLNILAGICLPALLIGFEQPTTVIIYAAIWLLCMKFISLLVASHHNGLHRVGGAVIMLLYLLFALAIMLWH